MYENVIIYIKGETCLGKQIMGKGMIIMYSDKNKKGFTLVELVVVIAIIGILASLLVPSMMSYIRKAKEKELIGDTKSIVDISAASLGYAYSSLDYGSAMVKSFNGDKCGVITSYDLHKAQNKDKTGMNAVDFAVAKDIVDGITPNGHNFDFSRYSGSKYDLISSNLSAYRTKNPDCPGFLLVFNQDGGIARVEYSLGNYICVYDGEYKVYREGETGAKFSTVS